MATNYSQHFSTRRTPQSQPIYGQSMVVNSAGGFTFGVDCWKRLERFLILGCEGGSYYASERSLTQENARCVLQCADEDLARTVRTIADISVSGRAPKNDPAVFALGLLSGHRESLESLNSVCRTATHLFQFIEAAQNNRGWGRSLKRAVQNWYLDKSPRDVALQLVKYQSRNGFSHRDALRLSKPRHAPDLHNLAFRWAVGKVTDEQLSELPPIYAFEQAKKATTAKQIVRLIEQYDLVRECIPTHFLNDASVWEALLIRMPITATIRNLGKMTAVGIVKPLSNAANLIVSRLCNAEVLCKGRVHPMSLLLAQAIYARGMGDKGSLHWSPVPQVIDALDNGFYAAFKAVKPTGKRWLLALDVSGSMAGAFVQNTHLSVRDASAAMALVTAAVEPQHAIIGFTGRGFTNNRRSLMGGQSGVESLSISPRQRLRDAIQVVSNLPMGRTDCALPMLYAMDQGLKVDTFVIYTDNETWFGDTHPCQALQLYRQKLGIAAKLIVVAMTSTGFTIADPNDSGMLDVVGFDTAVPAIMSDFAR